MKNTKNILLTAFLLETLCVTYALHLPWLVAAASVVHTLAGFAISYALLFTKPGNENNTGRIFDFKTTANRYRWVILIPALVAMCYAGAKTMAEEPPDYRSADMLPIIQVMCQRFLAGHWLQVYAPIQEIWNGTVPIYLPAMWLPFSLPEFLRVDLRWLTVLLFFIVLGCFLWRVSFRQKTSWLVFLCGFLLFCFLFTDEKPGLVAYTEEGIVVFYYVLLTMVLLRKKQNIGLLGICTSLCVLSRYALIGWLPAMLLYFAWRKEWKNLLRFTFTGLACFLLLVLLPFGTAVVHSMMGLPGAYIAFTARVWNDSPEVFSTGPGLAKFFGPGKIETLHYLLIVLTFCLPLLAMISGLLARKKYKVPDRNLPIAVFKLSLVVFYCFIDVPYLYLFYTSSFVSLIAVASFVQRSSGTVGPRP